jgi:hypothetical protein
VQSVEAARLSGEDLAAGVSLDPVVYAVAAVDLLTINGQRQTMERQAAAVSWRS